MKVTFNPSASVVSPKLLRGKAVLNPYTLYQMRQSGINQIIDLRNSSVIKGFFEKLFCRVLGIKYFNCRYPHRLNTLPGFEFFENINKLICQNAGKTYIHCQYGKRRTGIAVAVYEKECLHKPKLEILTNLYNLGFNDLLYCKKTSKRQKYLFIINDFLKRYYPNKNGPSLT